MGIFKDTFFGGAEKDAAKQQMYHQREAQDLLRKGVEEGRGYIADLYPQGQEMARQGFAGAMDVFNQATPQQMQTFQQGNVGAQNALLSGLPQMNNAILGGPIDYGQLQAQQLQQPEFNFNTPSFLQAPQQQSQQQFSQYDYNTPMQQPSPFSLFSGNYDAAGGNNTFGGPLSIGGGFRDFSQRGNIRER